MTAPLSRTVSRRGLFARNAAPAPARNPVAPVIVADSCFAGRGIYCRTCSESCPEGALRIVPLLGGKARVIVDAERCNSCGACIEVCPASALALAEPAAGDET